MNDFYDSMADTAQDLLSDYGKDLVLTRIVPGAYNPTTGIPGAPTPTTYTVKALVTNFNDYRVANSGGLIKTGDRRIFVAAKNLPIFPDPATDSVTLDGVTWKVVNATKPVDAQVIYELQVRRTGAGG